MNLFYEILADSLVAIHLGYMVYVVVGQLAILIGWPLLLFRYSLALAGPVSFC